MGATVTVKIPDNIQNINEIKSKIENNLSSKFGLRTTVTIQKVQNPNFGASTERYKNNSFIGQK